MISAMLETSQILKEHPVLNEKERADLLLNLNQYYFYKKSYIRFTIIKKICIIMMLNSITLLQATES